MQLKVNATWTVVQPVRTVKRIQGHCEIPSTGLEDKTEQIPKLNLHFLRVYDPGLPNIVQHLGPQ